MPATVASLPISLPIVFTFIFPSLKLFSNITKTTGSLIRSYLTGFANRFDGVGIAEKPRKQRDAESHSERMSGVPSPQLMAMPLPRYTLRPIILYSCATFRSACVNAITGWKHGSNPGIIAKTAA